MYHHRTFVQVTPSLQNSSCTHPRYNQVTFWTNLTTGDVVQASVVLILTMGIIVANLLLISVINSRRYSKYIHSQPRYLLTSLACNDLAMGLLVTPFAVLPSLRNCWPYGELVCQIQALLRGAISQQSAVILICMAMDRYFCMLHPVRYHKHSSKKGCVALISMTWVLSMSLFTFLVLPSGGFYFNSTGMMACEPFYRRSSVRILAACGFYFPTTMILMYCYGSAFHVNKLRLRKFSNGGTGCNAISSPDGGYIKTSSMEKLLTQERKLSTSASRTMAAMSLGFIVLVTPWTIQEVVAACTGSRAPRILDFLATWLALSDCFWNPFLYWLLNNHFRRISKDILKGRIFCRKAHQHKQEDSQHCCNNTPTFMGHVPGCDLEGLSEKYWGEILERTLSSSSLHALQGAYSQLDCNGLQEMRILDLAVPDL
ncbi:trace amine-associated receptor 8c [Cylas formicarius]|uniref:trace amine-associated receptor 8c n=1 Tax=Cylas formicarius TaxID=197179 RepID=UPI0029583596|nr:trace amine-associated receptor 8c [Cylas formicarius]